MTGSVMDGVSWQDGPKAQAIAADDVLKADALRRVKLAATALLAFCGLLFLLARMWRPKHPAFAWRSDANSSADQSPGSSWFKTSLSGCSETLPRHSR